MKYAEITVKYWLEDEWGENEIYEIVEEVSDPENGRININTPLARAIINKKPQDIITVNGGKYLVIDIISEATLLELIASSYEYFKKEDNESLIMAGWKLAKIISNSIKPPRDFKTACMYIISAHLTLKDVEEAIKWLDIIESHGYDVIFIKEKLLQIKKEQSGLTVEDIDDAFTLNQLAKLNKQLCAYKNSLLIYKRSINIDANNVFTYNGIGGLCRAAGWLNEGIDYYSKGLQISYNSASLNGLGGIYRDLKDLITAELCYRQALNLNKDDKYAHNGLGAVYFDQELYAQGEEQFLLAGDVNFLFNLANEYKTQNMIEKSLQCLKVILAKEPSNEKAKKLYKRFSNGQDY